MSSGASVAIQATENTTVSNTDPVFQLTTAPIGYASGFVNLSRQLLDRSVNDSFIASELGRAAGERIDVQLLNGSGSSGQTRGLLNLSGVVATTYTDATPTPGEMLSKLGSNYADISLGTNYGRAPDTLLLHPRRNAWLNSQNDTAGQPIVPQFLRLVKPIEVPSIPLTLGAGTEDAGIHFVSEGVSAYVDPPAFELFGDPLSGNLEVRARVLTRIALVVPITKAVGTVSGTGFIAAVFA